MGPLRGLRWGLLAEVGCCPRSWAAAALGLGLVVVVVGESDEAEAEEENVGVAIEAEPLEEETEAVVGAELGASPLRALAADPLDLSISTTVALFVRSERIVSIIVATP